MFFINISDLQIFFSLENAIRVRTEKYFYLKYLLKLKANE